MSKLQIDLSGKGGLAPRFWGDYDRTSAQPELRIIGANDQMADGIYNPFRKYGYMSPANGLAANITGDTGFDALATSSLYDPVNDDFYFAESGQKIWKGDTLDDTSLSEVEDMGATGTPVIQDLEIYEINGARRIFFLYEKSGNMEIGESALPISGSGNLNWLSTDVSGNFSNTLTNRAFMRVADNGFMYIFQDNNIHRVDGSSDGGATGTVEANILQFPGYFQIVDAIDYRGNMYTAIHQSAEAFIGVGPTKRANTIKCGIYIWDRLTSVVRTRDFISLEGVKQIRKIFIAPAGDIRVVVVNAENITEIRKFNGQTFIPIIETGYLSYPEYHDSLTNVGGLTIWLGYDGIVYAHGKISPFDKEALYKISSPITILNNSGTRTGAILFGGANADVAGGLKPHKSGIYYGWRSSSPSYVISELDLYGTGADGVNATPNTGNVYTLVKYLPPMSTVNYLDVFCTKPSAGSSTLATLKIYFNGSSSAWANKLITGDMASKGYFRIDIGKSFINSIQLEIEWNSGILIGLSNDFCPSLAIVDYTPTNTKG